MAQVRGTAGDNNLRGTAGRDTILGLAGNDTINPGRGADRVEAGVGADVVHWDQDALSSGVIDTYIGGMSGESYDPDPYFERSGGDRLVLTGQAGFRVTFSSTEDGQALDAFGNRLNFTQFERLTTGNGNDVIDASRAVAEPARGSGDNYVPVHGIDIISGAGNDRIIGSNQADNIDAGAGNDTIHAGGGWDFIQSSTGNDLIYGEGGNDNIRWGQGNPEERIGNDTIYGGEANEEGGDLLNMWVKDWDGNGVAVRFNTTESGSASTHIGGGTSTLRFFQFENFFTHEGRDTVTAENATAVHGNKGIHFNTRWGDDILTGSRFNDTLEGGEGADTLDGGRGNDFISMVQDFYLPLGSAVTPDAQRDVLVIRDGGGYDTIRAFQVGDVTDGSGTVIRRGDVLNLSDLHDAQGNLVDINDVRVSESNGHAVLTFPNGERIMMENVRAASLTRAALLRMGIRNVTAEAQALAAATEDESDATTTKEADDPAAQERTARLSGDRQDLREVQGDGQPVQQMAALRMQKRDSPDGSARNCGPVTCFCAGTLIDTPRGPVAVETLQPGDLVLTRDNGARPVRWVGRRVLGGDDLAQAPQLHPIRIAAGALGLGVPAADLLVSPQHRVLVRSSIAQRMFGAPEVLVAAKQLLALEGITREQAATVEYVHILFKGHQIVISNGAPTESLFTGAEALRSLGRAARDEIFAIFPELRDAAMPVARPVIEGQRARQMAQRHQRNGKALLS